MLQHRDSRCQAEVYLDNNATTAVLPCAAQAVLHHMQTCFGNPSSSHSTGIKAKVELELTRQLARHRMRTGEPAVNRDRLSVDIARLIAREEQRGERRLRRRLEPEQPARLLSSRCALPPGSGHPARW
mgnify:CR=1 FL=1